MANPEVAYQRRKKEGEEGGKVIYHHMIFTIYVFVSPKKLIKSSSYVTL